MMNVTLLGVGRLREEYFSAACKEYEKRLKGFCRFETVIIEPERLSAEPSEKYAVNVRCIRLGCEPTVIAPPSYLASRRTRLYGGITVTLKVCCTVTSARV